VVLAHGPAVGQALIPCALPVDDRGHCLDHVTQAGAAGGNSEAPHPMDYTNFNSLQILLLCGSAIALCVWQLRAVQRSRRQRAPVRIAPQLQRRGRTVARRR
jgi:hypothetical protein